MQVFGSYSSYYNLLYKDKDYAGESAYVHRLIQQYRPGAHSVLDLGCGTGLHDLLLAQECYEVVGVDRSAAMLDIARKRVGAENKVRQPLVFHHGDIRTVRLGRTFDAVLSLFHVISYQSTNADLGAAFATAREHLAPGGVFIFDCWYGPAVLTDRPAVRVKRMEDGEVAVTRIVEPVMHPNDNLVDLNYQVLVRDKTTGSIEDLRETHRMRYLFRPELEVLLAAAGLHLAAAMEWMSDRPLGFTTWGACFVAKAMSD